MNSVVIASLVLASLLPPWRAGAQSAPYTYTDVTSLLESGVTPVRLSTLVAASCYAGSLTPSMVNRLRTAGADGPLLEVLRSRPCPVSAAGAPRVASSGAASDTPLDRAFAAARELITRGDAAAPAIVLSIGQTLFLRSQNDSTLGFERAVEVLRYAYEVNTGALKVEAQFFYGAANTRAALGLVQDAATTRDCAKARKSREYLAEAQIHLPAGSPSFPQQAPPYIATAMQLSAYADQVVAAVCR